jgi:hypothetical protein
VPVLPTGKRVCQRGTDRESPYTERMSGNDTSAAWRFFTRGPGLFYTWPFLPLFKYLPILFGSTPPESQPRPQRQAPIKAHKKRTMRRLARVWKLLRLTTKLRIPFRAMLAAYRHQNSRQQSKAQLQKRSRTRAKAQPPMEKAPQEQRKTREEFEAWRRSHRAEPRPWERDREQSRGR